MVRWGSILKSWVLRVRFPRLTVIDEVRAGLCVLSGCRGAVEAAPETTDYCLSVSVSVSVTPVVAVGASATLESPGFSVSAGSVGVPEALGVAVC